MGLKGEGERRTRVSLPVLCVFTALATRVTPCDVFTGELCLAEILVLAGTAGAGGMASPTSTRISARLKCVQERSSRLSVCALPRSLIPNLEYLLFSITSGMCVDLTSVRSDFGLQTEEPLLIQRNKIRFKVLPK